MFTKEKLMWEQIHMNDNKQFIINKRRAFTAKNKEEENKLEELLHIHQINTGIIAGKFANKNNLTDIQKVGLANRNRNKEKRNLYNKVQYDKNRVKICKDRKLSREKKELLPDYFINCICGGHYTKINANKYFKTNKHEKYFT